MFWALTAHKDYFEIYTEVMNNANWDIILREFEFVKYMADQMQYSLKTPTLRYRCYCKPTCDPLREYDPIHKWSQNHSSSPMGGLKEKPKTTSQVESTAILMAPTLIFWI